MDARVIGKVVSIQGVVFARSVNGTVRQLKFGDSVFEGDVVTTMADSHVELAFEEGARFLLRAKETVTLDSTLFDNIFGQTEDASTGLLARVGEQTTGVQLNTQGGLGDPEDNGSADGNGGS